MTDSDTSTVLSPGERRSFILRKLFSLTGVVPIGAFLLIHLWTYSSALAGRHAFEQSISEGRHLPYWWLLEVLFIWLPLAFHAVYGLMISLEARPNVTRYAYARNWAYVWQRLSGLMVLAFIGYHAYQFPLQIALGELERDELFSKLCGSFSATTAGGIPLMAAGYLVGLAATCYHLANGLTSFCFAWGITTSQRASRRVSGFAGLLAIVLFALGASSVLYFATGSRLVLAPAPSAGAPPPLGCQDLEKGEQARSQQPMGAEWAALPPAIEAAVPR